MRQVQFDELRHLGEVQEVRKPVVLEVRDLQLWAGRQHVKALTQVPLSKGDHLHF